MHEPLRFRQVHLDFHTSEHIPEVGADFDPEAFAATLERARVNSINLFARCHHGYLYYRSERFADRVHPALRRDLLREQIEACHARDIRCPVYITVQWDHLTAGQHPEWLVTDGKGAPIGTPPYEAGFYRTLCLNTPYVDWLRELTADVLDHVPADGLWFDIVGVHECSCPWCRRSMLAAGRDPSRAEDRYDHGLEVFGRFTREMTAFVRARRPELLVFYNSGHVAPRHRAALGAFTHLELESLPSGGWGYLHFPVTARYARTLGRPFLGMTGKFHTSWGDFHSFKNPAALAFECFTMLALNARCSVGDQLHPRGRICPHTYELIGSVYREVERREPWCRDARPVCDLGVFTPEAFGDRRAHISLPRAVLGAVMMLQEGRHQFDLLDAESDLADYRVLVLPDGIPVSPALAGRLRAFLAGGGALLATHRSGLDEAGAGFALEELGVSLRGEAPWCPDFVVPRGDLGRGLPATEHVMYERALEVEPAPGTEVLADAVRPYFNRTWRQFCSHRHTPSAGEAAYPAAVRRGRAIYFAHPLFTLYRTHAPRWCRTLLLNALDLLLPEPVLRAPGAPSTLLTAVNAQDAEDRWVVHLLHYIPVPRAESLEVVEEPAPLAGVEISLRVPRPVAAVRAEPEGAALPFAEAGGRVRFTVPRVDGHQLVSVAFAS